MRFINGIGLLFLATAAWSSPTPEVVLSDLEHPWSIAWIGTDQAVITERPGRMVLVNMTQKTTTPISGVPEVSAIGQGGLLDLAILQDAESPWIYFSLSAEHPSGGFGTELWRGRLAGAALVDTKRLFQMRRGGSGGRHFGGRLVLDDQHVLLTIGDRGEAERAQDLNDHAGKVIRLTLDGSIPADNPLIGQNNVLPEIYSYGHRNPQGAAIHPITSELWIHEHGPQGGDEINRVIPGTNYGWPVITHGRTYGLGLPIGEGTEKAGMAQPVLYWDPSIAPSGMTFYTGDRIPEWTGNLLVGALKAQMVVRLHSTEEEVRETEQLYRGQLGRVRDVRTGPDGHLYLLTDSARGQLIRVAP